MDFFSENIKAGNKVCKTKTVEPAVPISNLYSPATTLEGMNSKDVEPSSLPLTLALHIWAIALTQVKCWFRD